MSGINISRANDRVAQFQREKDIKKFDNIELLDYQDEEKIVLWLDKEDYEKVKKIAEEIGWN